MSEKSANLSRESPDFLQERARTQYLINSATIIDFADAQTLPAVYRQLEEQFGYSPSELGAVTAARALLQALSTPFWGWLGDRYSRKKILALGCFLWGFFTLLVALSTNYMSLLISRALTGLGLAIIFPTSQSLVADYFAEDERGQAFGWLGLTGVLGAITGTLYATAVADTKILGIDGWRFAFLTLVALSFALGIIIWLVGKDPVRGISESALQGIAGEHAQTDFGTSTTDAYKQILSNKTFLLVIAQGVAGTIPWNSILFIILWFEYVGFDPIFAGLVFAVVAMGAAVGNLFGGWLGDKAAQWNPDRGRIMMAQVSVASGIPMMFLIFWFIPRNTELITTILFLLIGTFTGFMISWAATACNNPLFSEIMPPEIRSSAFAVDRLFEGSIAATGTLIVGLLAEYWFGYITPAKGVDIADLPEETIKTNIDALANALIVATVIPWLICLFFFTFVYFTYPQDRDRLKALLQARRAKILQESN
jgi:MFS family permease